MTIKESPQNLEDIDRERERIETMINSPQVRQSSSKTRSELGYIRPRNASTMILVDSQESSPRILMGRRNKKLKFMPGALVFPGGSVDRGDGDIPASDILNPRTEERLLKHMRGKPTKRGARALAMAAIREVAEESGLLVGERGDFQSKNEDWKDFADAGIVPSLKNLRLFSRAITPPGPPRRFDTWFFIVKSEAIGHVPEGGFDPDGELEDLQWIKPEDALVENTREITRVMLVELMNRLKQDPDLDESYPAPFYQFIHSRFDKKVM